MLIGNIDNQLDIKDRILSLLDNTEDNVEILAKEKNTRKPATRLSLPSRSMNTSNKTK